MSGLILLPILTRVFSVDEYGAVDIVATFVSLLAAFAQFALPSAIARYFGQAAGEEERRQLFTTVLAFVGLLGLSLALLLSAAAAPLAGLLLGDAVHADYIRLGCGVAWVQSLAAIPYMTLRMERRIVAFNLLQIFATTGYIILALYLVLARGSGVRGVFIGQLVAGTGAFIIALVLTRRHLTARLSASSLRKAVGFSGPMLPGRLGTWANEQTDRLLLLLFLGLPGVALFGVTARIASLVHFLLLVFRRGWQPYAMLLIDDSARGDVYRRMLNYYAAGFASLGLVLTAISPELFALLVPEDYRGGYVVLPWLVGAAIFHHSASITNLGVLVSARTGVISVASAVGLIGNVAIASAMIPTFGIAGAAIGAFVSELGFTAILWRASVARSDVRFDSRRVLLVLTIYVVGAISLLLASKALVGLPSAAVRAALLAGALLSIARAALDREFAELLASVFRRRPSVGRGEGMGNR
jgi:O-antigen/teichoic acid export membrane protein